MTRHARHTLLGTTALSLILAAAPALAQEAGDGFLGTISLGKSKRDVATDTATAVTEIDSREIADRQAGTMAELIDSVPGVTLVNGATAQGSGINIRGYGANSTYGTDQKVLIQVDGVTRGSEELYRIGNQLFTDPALYKEVEVIRGTVGSFEYGSGVVGGVVRLETKDASDFTGGTPGFAYRQTFEFQSNGAGLTASSILAWQPTEKLEFLLSHTRRTLGTQSDGDGNLINPAANDVDDPSWLAKARLTFGDNDEHSLTASYTSTESTEYDVPYDSFGTTTFGNVDREVNSETFMLRYGYNPLGNDLIDLTAQLSYANEEILQTAVVPGNPLLDADHQYETTTLTLKNRARFDTGALGHSLVTGVELINRKRLNASSAPGGEDDRWAVFAVDEIQIGEAWTVTPALRYESSTIQGSTAPTDGRYSNDALMGGLSLRYAFSNGWSVFGSAAYTEVLPPIDDLDNIARVTQSEKSRTYEIGAAYERRDAFRAGDNLSFKINAYDTKLWDVTSFVSTTIVGGIPVFTDLDEINTQGIEIEASYALENGLYMDANLNIADGSETTAAQIEQDWRNLAANSARLTLGKRFGETYDLSWEAVAADDITVNGVRSSGYVTHNLRATIAPQSGVWAGTEFRIGVENLFDKQYQPHLSTRAATGRNVKLTLAKTF
ncbi:TonB-dependent receptor [Roseovarius sp.]|uniref:TonB-dependent receptor domain-containing protein n=1 Tax=Roseovarius sp. TaxID=1486281 RepID=UPI000C3B297F|nr:TonB-dependent receptor [Roseovarius sp.]MAO27661.1 ligand-gated channel [Roseovarius sp.]MAZ21278.1 ligand-gated channel [Roseovarius sp.]